MPSLPLFKYLLQKVRLPRHLGLCKTRAERGKTNTEIRVGRAGWGTGGNWAGTPQSWVGVLLLGPEVHFNLSASWARSTKDADSGVGVGHTRMASRTI